MKKILLSSAFFFFSLSSVYALPALPNPSDPFVAIQYGDFYSYSLPLLDYLSNGGSYNASDEWYVASPKPGEAIVIYTNAQDVINNPVGMDNAYEADGNASNYSSYYLTQEEDPVERANDDAKDPNWFDGSSQDSSLYWDADLETLTGLLGGSDLIFFFNNNQKDSTDEFGNPMQNLFGWGQVQLVDTDGLLDTLYFDFTNEQTNGDVEQYDNQFGTASPDSPQFDVAATDVDGAYDPYVTYTDIAGDFNSFDNGDFVLSGGDYCVAKDTDGNITNIYPGPCSQGDDLLDHNLGKDNAAYALWSPELSGGLEAWLSRGYDTFRVDMRLEFLNNGPEELFILLSPEEYIAPVPEPSTLLLLVGGFLGLGVYVRRRRK